MQGPNVHFAKIVATPTPTAWSQAYNAGSLFAVLALTSPEGSDALNALGKEIFNNLEAEFFTLEEKNLATIKDALTKSCEHVPDTIDAALCVAFIKDNILYLFLRGNGKVLFKRDATFGMLLERPGDQSTKDFVTASGYLTTNDTVLLLTESFLTIIPASELRKAVTLDMPNDIAETLAPKVHETTEGGAAGIILTFKGSPATMDALATVSPEHTAEETDTLADEHGAGHPTLPLNVTPQQHTQTSSLRPSPLTQSSHIFQGIMKKLSRSISALTTTPSLKGRATVFLGLAILVFILLVGAVMTTLKQQEQAKTKAHFAQVYGQAEKEYEEGESLLGLNKNLAREDFQAAKTILVDAKDDFTKGSDEEKQILDLLTKTEEKLQEAAAVNSVQPEEADAPKNSLIAIAQKQTKALAFGQDGTTVYYVTSDAVFAVTKSNGRERKLITNTDDWSDVTGISSYLGNMYVLDTQENVLKFVAAGSSYAKSSYFPSGQEPDLDEAVHMTIDGSVWILLTNGSIEKYTRAKPTPITLSGLDMPFSKPTRIITDAVMDSIYILDNGNSRIVKLSKDGAYQAQYHADMLNTATELMIDEAGKKAYILQNGKTFMIALK